MSSYKGKFNIIENPPYASDIYYQLYNEKVTPPPSQFRITEDGVERITEDGQIRETE